MKIVLIPRLIELLLTSSFFQVAHISSSTRTIFHNVPRPLTRKDRHQGVHDAFVIIVPGNCSGIIQFRSNFSFHPLKNPRPIRCR